jgi:hypothetical protein
MVSRGVPLTVTCSRARWLDRDHRMGADGGCARARELPTLPASPKPTASTLVDPHSEGRLSLGGGGRVCSAAHVLGRWPSEALDASGTPGCPTDVPAMRRLRQRTPHLCCSGLMRRSQHALCNSLIHLAAVGPPKRLVLLARRLRRRPQPPLDSPIPRSGVFRPVLYRRGAARASL